jgi:hypothetical protein
MTLTFKTLLAATLATAAVIGALPAQAKPVYGGRYVILGGVNLDAYCKRYHGQGFKAVVVEPSAGGWRCNNFADAVFGISVQRACEDTYAQRPIKSIVVGSGQAGDWRCRWSKRRP